MNIVDKFLEFENENRLFDKTYKGVHFWHIIRMDFWQMILAKQAEYTATAKKKLSVKRDLGFIFYFLKQFFIQKRKKKYDVLVSTPLVMQILDDSWINPYTSFLNSISDITFKKINHYTDWQKVDRYNWNTSPIRMRSMFTKIRYYLFKESADPLLINLIEQINDEFDLEICPTDYAIKIQKSTHEFIAYKNYYKRLIHRRFKLIFMTCHYSFEHFALTAAAKELSIPVIEYQHGVITLSDISYNVLNQTQYYPLFPDYIFTYSDYWNNLTHLPFHCLCLTTGNPMLDEFRKKIMKIAQKDNFTIIIYSTPILSERLSHLALQLKNILGNDYRIIYKLHPAECLNWESKYQSLVQSGIQVLYQPINSQNLMRDYQYHIGVGSATLFEATAFNNNIYIMDVNFFSQYTADLVEKRYALRFHTSTELALMILHAQIPPNYNPDRYYAADSLKKMAITLDKILNSSN